MQIFNSVFELTVNTPLLRAQNFSKSNNLKTALLAKLEYFNPAGSVKDRVARAMLLQAERDGRLKKGSVIIEPTSGNTGIALAAMGAARSYRVIVVMPDTMSIERRRLTAAYGAEIILTDGAKGMQGAIDKVEELAKTIPNAFVAGQFTNPANPYAHFSTTAPEIWNDTQGKIDIFVAGVGTGGTITGAGRYFKGKNPAIKIVAVEPQGSPVLTNGKAGAHNIQGIGAGFIPETLDKNVVDEVVTVTDDEAFCAAKAFARTEGILAGISSGAALHAAAVIAACEENYNKTIVALLPDGGERYLSEGLYD